MCNYEQNEKGLPRGSAEPEPVAPKADGSREYVEFHRAVSIGLHEAIRAGIHDGRPVARTGPSLAHTDFRAAPYAVIDPYPALTHPYRSCPPRIGVRGLEPYADVPVVSNLRPKRSSADSVDPVVDFVGTLAVDLQA